MAVTYKKLFHLLIEKAGSSANILTRLRRDQYVYLDCTGQYGRSLMNCEAV